MNHTDLEKLAREALELSGKATGGPWKAHFDPGLKEASVNFEQPAGTKQKSRAFQLAWIERNADHNSAFIAHARTDVPALAQAVLDLVEENRRLKVRDTFLTCLESVGVDNWEGCCDASRMFDDFVKAETEKWKSLDKTSEAKDMSCTREDAGKGEE